MGLQISKKIIKHKFRRVPLNVVDSGKAGAD